MFRYAHPNRKLWRQHYYMSQSYRDSLTRVIGKHLRPDDFEHDFFVMGAMCDVPRLVEGRSRCFSYHDGNLAQRLKSPYAPTGLSVKRIEEGLSFERRVYERTDRILVMSEYLRRSFVEDCGVPPSRVGVVGVGVNFDEIPPVFPDKRYDTKEILFIGVDFQRKGGMLLLKAFREVRAVHHNAKLHIVGPIELQLPPELSRGVVVHGFLNKSEPGDAARLSELFRVCSVFVMPSLYEPFGIAPLEAMIHQIPAVVSRAWALEETVTAGVTGEHVEPGSVDDLVQCLRNILANPDMLQRLGTAARASVLGKFTWPHVISRIIAEISTIQEQPS
jgi:glycosyltransferase involved in cell wall biosynthesis